MADLLSAFNGGIPVGALRSKCLHNRVNKLVPEKKKVVSPVVKGGDSIVVESIDDPPVPREIKNGGEKKDPTPKNGKKVLDEPTSEVVKIDTTQEVEDEPKPKRKYSRRKKRNPSKQ